MVSRRVREWLTRHTSYFLLHVSVFVVSSIVCAAIIQAIEGDKYTFVDCLLSTISACCLGSLISIDTALLTFGSQMLLFLLMLCGGVVVGSIVPPLIRLHYLKKNTALAVDRAKRSGDVAADLDVQLGTDVEYSGLCVIVEAVLGYWFAVQMIVIVVLALYFQFNLSANATVIGNGSSPWWYSAFSAVSNFANAGLVLFSSAFAPWAADALVLLLHAALILSGNVLFPLFLRLLIAGVARWDWRAHRRAGARFLLLRPRRCYTMLFSAKDTLQLVLVIAGTLCLQWFVFLATEYNTPLLAGLPGPARVLDGFFMAVSSRSAGVQTQDISQMAPVLQLVYAVMMYLTAYPLILTIHGSSEDGLLATQLLQDAKHSSHSFSSPVNAGSSASAPVEQSQAVSLEGIEVHADADQYAGRDVGAAWPEPQNAIAKDLNNRILTNDVMWLLLSWALIVWIEGDSIVNTPFPRSLSPFGILFELCSAYGTSGFTFGYPAQSSALALSAQFHSASKLIVILVMVAGRHRGLPYAVDSAVYLPALLGLRDETTSKSADGDLAASGRDFRSAKELADHNCVSEATLTATAAPRPRTPVDDRSKENRPSHLSSPPRRQSVQASAPVSGAKASEMRTALELVVAAGTNLVALSLSRSRHITDTAKQDASVTTLNFEGTLCAPTEGVPIVQIEHGVPADLPGE